MNLFPTALTCCAAMLTAGMALADLIPSAGLRLSVPITLIDDRPFLSASANGVEGLVLFDTGTPFAILMNRAFVPLDEGRVQASGTAASGQAMQIRDHGMPRGLRIAGQDIASAGRAHSADLGFVAEGMGLDLIGFVGLPMVDGGAFGLDYHRGRMLLMGTAPDGTLAAAPDPAEVLAEVAFLLPKGDQPLFAGTVGGDPVLIDLDTGDIGTLYLSAATQAAWRGAELLAEGPEGPVLHSLAFGGAAIAPQAVQLVTAGGAEDHRPSGQPDLLRLGGRFLRQYPTLWNLAGHRFTVLRPSSRFFGD